jgi:hypothetical protein
MRFIYRLQSSRKEILAVTETAIVIMGLKIETVRATVTTVLLAETNLVQIGPAENRVHRNLPPLGRENREVGSTPPFRRKIGKKPNYWLNIGQNGEIKKVVR